MTESEPEGSSKKRAQHENIKKRKLIDEFETALANKKKISHQDLAIKYGFKDRSTVTKLLKEPQRQKIKDLTNAMMGEGKSRVSSAKHEHLEKCVLHWIAQILNFKDNSFALNGKLIQEKAIQFASLLDVEEFKASDGWLSRFKKRNGLSTRVYKGEAASVAMEHIASQQVALKALLAKYKSSDVFNADETGLYWRAPPKRGLVKGESSGVKKDKSRITVLFCVNADGSEYFKPLVIGKSQCPQPFKRGTVDLRNHPHVSYVNNKTAWMNSEKWEQWLRSLDGRMKAEKRNVLLLVDNFSGHKVLSEWEPTNVKVHFLPPNTTSRLQPLDAGMISDFKRKYSALLSRHWVNALDNLISSSATGSTSDADLKLVKLVNMKMVFCWIDEAWRGVKASSIANCWRHTGIIPDDWLSVVETAEQQHEKRTDQEREGAEILAMLMHKEVIHECGGSNITVEEYLSIDSALDELSLATDEEIISQVEEEINGTAKQVEEKEMEEPVPVQLASEAELVSALKKLNLWCQFRGQDSLRNGNQYSVDENWAKTT
ncbi:unnamed protein product [Tilletia caries]|uniref:HTH CENPB-type domain-containing protein n=2 Tax=Tilletia caries TaxID=13290 RepID=A0ABN7IML1_9BASI|nr:unnamed protein product [Tilletia caries]CAD6911782.1 unnamed protein product [Tilletia caries]CAD6932119.1 unnamed protein product [Tilletia controversa]CAD7062809.1 unnamed protein product [Tilletia caries]